LELPRFEIDDEVQLRRLRDGLSDDAAHAALVDAVPEIKAIVERAKAMGCNLYGCRLRRNLAIDMWFLDGHGAECKARISFKDGYKRLSGRALSHSTALELESAVLTLVLNSEGMEPAGRD
jgi:hypothetical protein